MSIKNNKSVLSQLNLPSQLRDPHRIYFKHFPPPYMFIKKALYSNLISLKFHTSWNFSLAGEAHM